MSTVKRNGLYEKASHWQGEGWGERERDRKRSRGKGELIEEKEGSQV